MFSCCRSAIQRPVRGVGGPSPRGRVPSAARIMPELFQRYDNEAPVSTPRRVGPRNVDSPPPSTRPPTEGTRPADAGFRDREGRSKRLRCEAREEWIPRRSVSYAAGSHDEAERSRWAVFSGRLEAEVFAEVESASLRVRDQSSRRAGLEDPPVVQQVRAIGDRQRLADVVVGDEDPEPPV